MAEANFRLPPPLKMSEDNLADQFREWKRQLDVYTEASGTTSKTVKKQAAIILHCAGPEAIRVFDQLEFEEKNEKKNDPKQVIAKLEQYCSPRNNEDLQRYRFWNLPLTSTLDKFATGFESSS